jgi:hypothetical protein
VRHRQRVMAWIVGVGVVGIVGAWLLIVRYEIQPGSGGNILTDIVGSIKNFNFTPTKTAPPKQQEEIQKYQEQVFPQFTNQ